MSTPLVLAVDGGNSKADIVLVTAHGRVLAARRVPTVSHQQVGLDPGVAALAGAVRELARGAGLPDGGPVAEVGSYCLAGADFPEEERRLRRALERTGLAAATIVRNDTHAALRAGATRPWGIALICGQGVNGIGVGRDGRTARFDAVGELSGDWGGGTAVGMAALAAAVRAADGRGQPTVLEERVPRHFGVRSPRLLVRALYHGRVAPSRLGELSPVAFEAARDGDRVARGIVDRLADELAAMALALARRARLTTAAPEVILAGGVFGADDPAFLPRLEAAIRRGVAGASFVRLGAPPVLGAALIGIDALGLPGGAAAAAEQALRAGLTAALFDGP